MSVLLVTLPADAGSIGFSIGFNDDDIRITNTGSDAAYQVSEWTLDATSQWQQVQVQQGNFAYLPPGKSLKSRRVARAASGGIGRADPLLLVFYDQAGSRLAQLAWRQTPAALPNPMSASRHDETLVIDPGANNLQNIVASYGVAIPNEGIQQLARPLTLAGAPPPNPLRHVWASATPLAMNTGAGQGGAWLVHENASGALSLQVIPDGVPRGQEQVPMWLTWVRRYLMQTAGVLAGLGLVLIVVGRFGKP
jgi:hypothetical protein